MAKKIVYLDNGSTTKIAPEVLRRISSALKKVYGNASSLHSLGIEAQKEIEKAREVIARAINSGTEEIIFTSGGTESNNLALKGIFLANPEKNHIITTKIEHSSVMRACEWLSQRGAKITFLKVNNQGFVDLKELEDSIDDKTLLISIIHGNNEIGTIQDLDKIGNICQKHNVYLHTDACQSFTKTFLDVKQQNIDLMTLNSHKIHGPKGIGVLFIKKGTNISSLHHGGPQEFNLRAGTENIPSIIGFAEAIILAQNKGNIKKVLDLRDKVIRGVLKIPGSQLNGPVGEKRLCNNASFSFKSVEGESIVSMLDEKGIAASTGSACAEKDLEPSHVLKAIGLSHEEAHGSLRLTLSRYTTEQEIDYFLKSLHPVIKRLREISPYGQEEKNVL